LGSARRRRGTGRDLGETAIRECLEETGWDITLRGFQRRCVCSSRPVIRPEPGCRLALVTALCRGGANPNGLDDDGLPLWTAITWGYPAAAEALARCGARVDNLVFAAALGDLPRVKTSLASHTGHAADQVRSGQRIGANGPVLDPEHMIEYALIYAAGHGRGDVVKLLLTRNPDLSVRDPCSTAPPSAAPATTTETTSWRYSKPCK
jgi:hypothetical protein